MKLTKKEWEIIEHRLGAPDAIAEVLKEEKGYDYNDVFNRVHGLLEKGQDCVDWNCKKDNDIIKDCCDGCTIFCDIQDAVSHGEISKGGMMNLFKAAKSLSEKIGVEVITI